MHTISADRIEEIPAPSAREPGWYRDPLGSGMDRYWDRRWLDLTRLTHEQPAVTAPAANGHHPAARKGLFSRLGFGPAPEEKAKSGKKKRGEGAERKAEFFASPAGRARLSFGQKHDVFQCSLSMTTPELFVIPSVEGTPPVLTADTTQILNSIVAEGWKLDAGSYFFSEPDGGVVGYFLFKRSKKRQREMNDPWKGEPKELA